MQGLVSIIEGSLGELIKDFWIEIEDYFGFQPVKPLIPHISWFGAQRFPEEPLKNLIEENFTNNFNLQVKCGGIALFPGKEIIIYIPITVSDKLLTFHNDIYRKLIVPIQDQIFNSNKYYYPNNWVPHITIIQQNEIKLKVDELFTKTRQLNNLYEFNVSNLSLLDSEEGILFEF